MLIKLGEAVSIKPSDIQPLEKIASDTALGIESKMLKFAEELKVIAPQAKDFLYFTCVMMHAAEASLINDDGTPKKLSNGELVTANWEKVGEEGIKWVCSDPSIKPYRNSNRDIFPSHELKLAYKNWVGRPLCLDHQSQSVDKIRGVIVDTVYDEPRHRVITLCALDKKNYPDLADKVASGVSKDVSMGTAVSLAVCSDCGQAARTEREFCQHMRSKSCYGEINVGLNPIELSLVVNGADKKAKIKHVIASDVSKAAELLTDYLQLKEAANKVSTNDLESIKNQLGKFTEKVNGLIDDSGEEDKSDAIGPTRSKHWAESIISDSTQINAPEAFPTYASELQKAILGAQVKIASLQENLLRLSKSEDSTMSTKNAYFQGTEEPKPGQKQYAVDPTNDKTRELDRNLVNITQTGNDGLFPGDEEKKRELLRLADEHERALFREAALKKAKEQLVSKGYFQGTEEPTPKKKQYAVDPLEGKDRKEDRQMVGKKPFPEVGKIDGLYPGDEETKKKLSRAALKARFEKVAMPDGRIDQGASRWVILANDQAILSATVDQITHGHSDSLYSGIATKAFGQNLLKKIQTEGFQATAASFGLIEKKAQAPAAPAPIAEPVAPPAEGLDDLTPPANIGGEESQGEIVEQIEDLTNELAERVQKLQDASGAVEGDAADLGGIAPAGDAEFAEGPAPEKTAAQLMSMRKRVNSMLQEGIGETVTALTKHIKELKTAGSVYKQSYASMSSTQRDYLNKLTVDAVKDAQAALSDSSKVVEAVVKYAYGTAELQKRAEMSDSEQDKLKKDIEAEAKKTIEGIEGKADTAKANDVITPGKDNLAKIEQADPQVGEAIKGISDAMKGDVASADGPIVFPTDTITGKPADCDDLKLKPAGDDTFEVVNASTKEGRAALRAKLAEKAAAQGFNELSQQAHPKGSVSAVDAGNLDTKPSIESAFHVAKDIKDYMLGLANMPPKVRKQAELIENLVSTGKLAAADVDQLVAHGVDGDAVKYWKQYYGQAKDPKASEFASKLTQEHMEAKKAEEITEIKGKIKRAYDLANQMVAVGMIAGNQVTAQVEDIMKWNDAGFDSMKNIIARQSTVKQASIPAGFGTVESSLLIPTSIEKTASEKIDLVSVFSEHFDRKGRY